MKPVHENNGRIGRTDAADSQIVDNDDAPKAREADENSASCNFGGYSYSNGSVICINQRDHRCRDGKWIALGTTGSCR